MFSALSYQTLWALNWRIPEVKPKAQKRTPDVPLTDSGILDESVKNWGHNSNKVEIA